MEIFSMTIMLVALILMFSIGRIKRKKEAYLLLILLCISIAIRLFYEEEYILSIVWIINTIIWVYLYMQWKKQ